MDNKLNVTLNEETKVLTILEGQALDPQPPKKVVIRGNIMAIHDFMKVRKQNGAGLQTVDLAKAYILIDKFGQQLIMQLDPENQYGAEIHAVLEESNELKPFGINTVQTFTREQLVKLIKFNRLNFDNTDKHSEMLLAFQKVNSTVNIQANEASDIRGNKERGLIQAVTTNAPTEFILNIPIFKGMERKKFRVEIGIDVTEGSARFWFESVELKELRESLIDQIFTDALENCQEYVKIIK